MQPLVSVIIPTYNRAGLIGQAIENMFEQTYPNLEVIIVDDGSTDNTKEVLTSYGSKIRWISQQNAGPSAARNRGLAMAAGEIIAFQDSDDTWHPSKIARQVSLLERAGNSVVCCICNTDIQSPGGKVITSFDNAPIRTIYEEGLWTNVAEVLTTRFVLFNQAAAIRKEVLNRIGGFDESLRYLEDSEFPLRLSLEGPWAFIRTPLVLQRQGTENSFSRGAFQDLVLTGSCEVAYRQSILRKLSSKSAEPRLHHLMEKYLRGAQRQLKGLAMMRSDSRTERLLGSLSLRVERFRGSIDRRLPGYPQMEVQSVTSPPPQFSGDNGTRDILERVRS